MEGASFKRLVVMAVPERALASAEVAMTVLVVPDRAEGRDAAPAVISKRSEKSRCSIPLPESIPSPV